MRRTAAYVTSLILAGAAGMALAQVAPQGTPAQPGTGRQGRRSGLPPGPNPGSQYHLGPDSMPQEGVPKGEIRGPFTLPCSVYPGTQHTYWVYVPAQYDPKVPADRTAVRDRQAIRAPGTREPANWCGHSTPCHVPANSVTTPGAGTARRTAPA